MQYIARTDIRFPGSLVRSGVIVDDADMEGHDAADLVRRGALEPLAPGTPGLPPEKERAKGKKGKK